MSRRCRPSAGKRHGRQASASGPPSIPCGTVSPLLLEGGTDIRIIQALLGHSRIDTTARYAAVSPNAIAGAISPLERLGVVPKSRARR
jgi:integrase